MDKETVKRLAKCPCCGLQWEENCEQHACIELFGECIICRFMPDSKGSKSGSQEDIIAIQAERRKMIAIRNAKDN